MDDASDETKAQPSGFPTTVSTGLPKRSVPPASDTPPAIAGYDLVRILGRGGMGVVWEAVEHRLDRHVALKVHSSSPHAPPDSGLAKDALWTEALVAARIGDPSIVSVLDVGFTVDERPYYAMELVHGTDLGTILADGPLAPRRAITLAADMARAASAAHLHGVVHRDLKPRNVIVDATGRARVVDFGIAFDVRKGDDPFAGRLAGSPPYMAPEQILGNVIGPATDIWAIGVILYEMLTGERPFAGATIESLLAAIVAHEPPPPSTKRSGVHGDLDVVVTRCLTKNPEARYPSAAALFETLNGIVEGQQIEVAPAATQTSYVPRTSGTMPAIKPRRDEAKKRLSWSWKLASSPAALWPFVADTDRFNKAVGLAPVVYTDEVRPDGLTKRTGEIRVLGLQVSWREYPFEWVKEREHSVFRWYNAGPISALWNKVTLVPLPRGGTELHHEVWLSPRGVIGQLAAFVELERKLAPAVDHFYRHLDQIVAAGAKTDPFEGPHVPSSEQRALVEAACARLHGQGFDAALIEKLAMYLLTAPDGVMKTLRPYALADEWKVDRGETLDAFIHAAHANLLEPAWDVICPKCMIAHESLDELDQVKKHGRCTSCATSFERDLKDSVELVFAPHPTIRTIERATFCAGSPARRPHVILQQVLEPGEQRTVLVELVRGTYRVGAMVAKDAFEMVASAVGFATKGEIAITGERISGRPEIVLAGSVKLTFHNQSSVEETVRVEYAGNRDDAVSAAAALNHPSFRSFFSGQLLAHGEHVRVRHLAFLFVQTLLQQDLFETLGDGEVCVELSRLDAVVGEVAREHEGEVVPSAMSVLVVAFPSSIRAFRAALALRARINALAMRFPAPIALALHDGRCIALTRGGKPEFFGETLHRGAALLHDCPPNGIALSASVMSDHAVAVAVHESALSVVVDKTQEGPYAGRRVTLLLPP